MTPSEAMPSIIQRALIAAVRLYRVVLSPILPPRCRHLPTCSEYAIEALQTYGPLRGANLTIRRVCRCHPWGTHGYDPVPIPPGTECRDHQ